MLPEPLRRVPMRPIRSSTSARRWASTFAPVTTEEDFRNRTHWNDYQAAAEEMFLRTSTPAAPWNVVEAEDKYFARVKVLRTLAVTIEKHVS